MPHACPVCHHRQAWLIDMALAQGQDVREIQKQWHLGKTALVLHRDCCLTARPQEGDAADAQPVHRMSVRR